MYIDDLPSKHTLDTELDLWARKWIQVWQERLQKLQEQHIQATGERLTVTPSEMKKLQQK